MQKFNIDPNLLAFIRLIKKDADIFHIECIDKTYLEIKSNRAVRLYGESSSVHHWSIDWESIQSYEIYIHKNADGVYDEIDLTLWSSQGGKLQSCRLYLQYTQAFLGTLDRVLSGVFNRKCVEYIK